VLHRVFELEEKTVILLGDSTKNDDANLFCSEDYNEKLDHG
jgi:hypothetical protein